MGSTTNISWLNYSLPDGTYVPGKTFNPWIGCEKVSEGCKNCYAHADAKWSKNFGKDAPRHITSDAYWKKPLRWNREAEEKGIRYRVFCGSYCDVFEARMDLIDIKGRLGNLIVNTPNLDWLLLTKRPRNAFYHFPYFEWIFEDTEGNWYPHIPPNVWIGTTVENQKQADIRIPQLLDIPAKVRFISCEPLLGVVELNGLNSIDWVIAGGESGKNRREMDVQHMDFIQWQCENTKTPFFCKQDSAHKPGQQGQIPDELWNIKEFPTIRGEKNEN